MPCHRGTYAGTWGKDRAQPEEERKGCLLGAHYSRGVSCRHLGFGSDSKVSRGVGKPSDGKRKGPRSALPGGWGPGEEDQGSHLKVGCPVLLVRGACLAFSG